MSSTYQKTPTLHDIEKRYVKSQDDGSIHFRDAIEMQEIWMLRSVSCLSGRLLHLFLL